MNLWKLSFDIGNILYIYTRKQTIPVQMKTRSGIIIIVVSLISMLATFSCAKDNYSHKYNGAQRSYSASANPSSKKATPVTKKYVVKGKRKAILGQSGTYR